MQNGYPPDVGAERDSAPGQPFGAMGYPPPQNMNGDGSMQLGMGIGGGLGMGAGMNGGVGAGGPMPMGAMPMPANGRMPVAVGGVVQAGLEPRSPPSKQNTSHVPCKFFRQGACQAGKACPFSHDLASTNDNVCKYFSKGNCKFGPKCANAHILPNGTRVSYRNGQPINLGHPPLNLGGRVHPDPYSGASASTLTNGLYRQNMGPGAGAPYYPQYGGGPEDFSRVGLDINGIPAIDTTYASERGSAYGSPRDDDLQSRYGLGLSPVPKGLSVLDVPLPASFDSQGISHIARYGPIASSVPSKFGLDSHSPASSAGFGEKPSGSALKNLYSSAYGNTDERDGFDTLGSPIGEEIGGKRVMHSQRFSRTKIMSASLPKSSLGLMGAGARGRTVEGDWDNDFTFEEDYLPDSLKELLTPGEKARRGSRNAVDEDGHSSGRPIWGSGAGTPDPSSHLNGNGNGNGTKFGSPSQASPSRWGPLFQRQKEEEERNNRASAFGHVGSPLRNSLLGNGASIPAVSRSGESGSPYASSPIRSGLGMSIISQQMQRTRLSQSGSGSEERLSGSGLRNASQPAPIGTPPSGGLMAKRIEAERTTSGGSDLRRVTSPIDEEIEDGEADGGDGVFRMEEEDADAKRNSGGSNGGLNGGSGGWTMPPGAAARRTNGSGMSGGGMEGMFGVNR